MFNVLIVEDCKITNAMLKKIVEAALGTNARVFQAFDVDTATALLDIIPMNLVFEDISLDDRADGMICIDYVFNSMPSNDTVVAVCTSYYDKNIVDQFAQYPIDKYILKPVVTDSIKNYVFTKYEEYLEAHPAVV